MAVALTTRNVIGNRPTITGQLLMTLRDDGAIKPLRSLDRAKSGTVDDAGTLTVDLPNGVGDLDDRCHRDSPGLDRTNDILDDVGGNQRADGIMNENSGGLTEMLIVGDVSQPIAHRILTSVPSGHEVNRDGRGSQSQLQMVVHTLFHHHDDLVATPSGQGLHRNRDNGLPGQRGDLLGDRTTEPCSQTGCNDNRHSWVRSGDGLCRCHGSNNSGRDDREG